MTQRIAVVTGGMGGIGTEICKHIARAGHQVIAADLSAREDRLIAFRQEVAEFGDRIRFEPVDVASNDSCVDLIRRVGSSNGAVATKNSRMNSWRIEVMSGSVQALQRVSWASAARRSRSLGGLLSTRSTWAGIAPSAASPWPHPVSRITGIVLASLLTAPATLRPST